jgi:hypothetical protein
VTHVRLAFSDSRAGLRSSSGRRKERGAEPAMDCGGGQSARSRRVGAARPVIRRTTWRRIRWRSSVNVVAMTQDRLDEADLPTPPRTTLAARYVRVMLTCWYCRHQRYPASLAPRNVRPRSYVRAWMDSGPSAPGSSLGVGHSVQGLACPGPGNSRVRSG